VPRLILIEFLWGNQINPMLAEEGNMEFMYYADINAIEYFAMVVADIFYSFDSRLKHM
jgi:hypothetical protein